MSISNCYSTADVIILYPLHSSVITTTFFSFLLLLRTTTTTTKPMLTSGLPAFIGDLPPRQYLRQICATSSSKSFNSDSLVLVDDFQHPSFSLAGSGITRRSRPLRKRRKSLADFSCLYSSPKSSLLFISLRTPITARQIATSVLNTSQLKYRQLTLLFDLERLVFENSAAFGQLLQTLAGEVLAHCHRCRPLVAVFDLSPEQLRSWSEEAVKNGLQNFQAVLVSSSSSSTVHLNPTLFGCQQSPGGSVFVPTSPADYQHLAADPSSSCNLQGRTLNASYNQKLPFCDIAQGSGSDNQQLVVVKFAVETEIVKVLQAKYNFSLRLFNARGAWGMLVGGRWTGTVGMVLNGVSTRFLRILNSNFKNFVFSVDQLRHVLHLADAGSHGRRRLQLPDLRRRADLPLPVAQTKGPPLARPQPLHP